MAREQDRVLPFEQVRWLNEAGFGRLRVPVEHGGDGIGFEPLFRLLIELAEADSSVAPPLSVALRLRGDSRPGVRGLPEPLVPPGGGRRDLRQRCHGDGPEMYLAPPAPQLSRDGEGWLLNGRKFYTTGTIFAEWIAVMASTEGIEGRQYAVVSTTQPGVEILDDWDGFGQRLTGTGTTIFRDAVRAPTRTSSSVRCPRRTSRPSSSWSCSPSWRASAGRRWLMPARWSATGSVPSTPGPASCSATTR